jgi:transposase InsO family protein
VYQLTAIDTATRWAFIQIVLGPVTAEHTRRFITHIQRRFRRLGWPLRAVLSDNGPEYNALRFRDHLAGLGLVHHRIPSRSPNHNAVCERFQGTMLQECWRPAFHRRRFATIRQLQATPGAASGRSSDTPDLGCDNAYHLSRSESAAREGGQCSRSPFMTCVFGDGSL